METWWRCTSRDWVVYPAQDRYEIDAKMTALPLSAVMPLAASQVRA
jgi:hypothetical protein